MSELLGETVEEDGLAKKLWSGGRNKYRSAWLKANGHYFKEFAKKAREAVDSVNSNIRLGACSCMTTWDFDGVSTPELAKILAGTRNRSRGSSARRIGRIRVRSAAIVCRT
jgi:hypothetical protein